MTGADRPTRAFVAVILAAALLASLGVFVWRLGAIYLSPPFTPDSWTLIALAKALAEGGYAADPIRQFRLETTAAISHPFGMPVLIAAAMALGADARAGVIVAGSSALLLLPLMIALAWRYLPSTPAVAAGIAAWAALVLNPYALEDIGAGRTLAPAALALAAALLVALAPYTSIGRGVLAGLLAGAAVMIRFDCVVPALALSAIFLQRDSRRRRGFVAAAFYTAALLAALSPWFAYSLACCGRLFVSEAVGLATSARVLHPLDWLAAPALTALEAPRLFAHKLAASLVAGGASFVRVSASTPTVWAAGALAVVAFARCGRRTVLARAAAGPRAALWLAIPAASALPAVIAGFNDNRYFVPATAFGLLTLACVCGPALLADSARRYGSAGARVGVVRVSLVALLASATLAATALAWYTPLPAQAQTLSFFEADFTREIRCLLATAEADSTQAARRVLAPAQFAFAFGARTAYPSVALPRNWTDLSTPERATFLRTFNVGYVLGPVPGVARVPIPGCGRLASIAEAP